MNDEQNTDVKKEEGASCCGCSGHKHAHDSENHQVLKTFDMYHFFSRKDVIAIIVLVLLLLGYTAYTTFVAPQPL